MATDSCADPNPEKQGLRNTKKEGDSPEFSPEKFAQAFWSGKGKDDFHGRT
jgi:hypothetical protein